MRSRRLRKHLETSWLSTLRRSRLPGERSVLSRGGRKGACLELVHDGYYLILKSFVRHLSASQVDLVSDEYDRHLGRGEECIMRGAKGQTLTPS